jgi:MFS family permease
MSQPKGFRFQTACFVIEGLNSFALVLYNSYLFFYLRARFGFHDRDNLLVAALLGLIYLFVAWQAGRFAQRRGYFSALKIGLMVMMLALLVGSQLGTAWGQIATAAAVTIGQCFTWPALEALVSESESPARLPHAIGMYNVTWAITAAAAFFIGGTLVQISFKNLFFVPLAVQAVELALVFWLQKHAAELARIGRSRASQPQAAAPPDPHRPSPVKTQAFLRMAWLANPFAYIAINTLIAVVPGLAAKFQLTPMSAGFVCSLWCFARLGAFAALWWWTDWHYRFRWLLGAYVLLIATFAAILTAPHLAVLIVAQLFFGGAIGLIYYSSLFYSMDAGDTKGEHGGIHEAVIGLGNCVGPATGATALWVAPGSASIGAWAVSGLLLLGLGGLCWLHASRQPAI